MDTNNKKNIKTWSHTQCSYLVFTYITNRISVYKKLRIKSLESSHFFQQCKQNPNFPIE